MVQVLANKSRYNIVVKKISSCIYGSHVYRCYNLFMLLLTSVSPTSSSYDARQSMRHLLCCNVRSRHFQHLL